MVYGAFVVVLSLSHVWFCNPKEWSTPGFLFFTIQSMLQSTVNACTFLMRKAEVQRDSSVTESCTDNQGQSQEENWSPDAQCLVCYRVSLWAAWLLGWCHVLLQYGPPRLAMNPPLHGALNLLPLFSPLIFPKGPHWSPSQPLSGGTSACDVCWKQSLDSQRVYHIILWPALSLNPHLAFCTMNAHVLHVMPWTRSSLRAGLSTHRSTNFANICRCEYPRPTEGGSDGGREAAPRKQDCPQWAEQPVLWGHLWSPAPQPRRGPHENTYLGQLNWRLDTWQVTMEGKFINRLFSSRQATLVWAHEVLEGFRPRADVLT